MATLTPQLIKSIKKIKTKVIQYSKINNPLIAQLGTDELEDAFSSGVTGLMCGPGDTIETEKQLITALVSKTEHAALLELNQRRNDQHLLDGYTGMSMSRSEFIRFPEKFIETLPERQALLARCRNMRLTYREIADGLELQGIEGQMGYVLSKYRAWRNNPLKLIELTQDERSQLTGTYDTQIIMSSLMDLKIGLIAKQLNQDPDLISKRKYQLLKKLPRIRDILKPR